LWTLLLSNFISRSQICLICNYKLTQRVTKLTVHQEINVTFAWLSISYFIFYKNIFITKVVHKSVPLHNVSTPNKASLQIYAFAFPGRCYCWLGEIRTAWKCIVFVASFVEYDQMFKESKYETEENKQTKQTTMQMRRCQKSIF